ncbi:hypothetical protein CPSG_03404 [Coccidioides posadasii str. Silveira]|uniref:Uncharacterized protein n=1 Tax=Coccidioides posadasii (strain RMSCC 757 / Silveira) TaxID=443226 RepID=E9CZX6_COCPS|nr:hypothetical protein CPSG_03404 [Coccidioides posadasii str. Silveira]
MEPLRATFVPGVSRVTGPRQHANSPAWGFERPCDSVNKFRSRIRSRKAVAPRRLKPDRSGILRTLSKMRLESQALGAFVGTAGGSAGQDSKASRAENRHFDETSAWLPERGGFALQSGPYYWPGLGSDR